MTIRLAMVAVALLSGCVTPKVTLHDIKEYDHAIQIAESRGIDTTAMHKHLVEMFIKYIQDPGEDPYLKAARDNVDAQQLQAFSSFIEANPGLQFKGPDTTPPMSPGEFFRGMGK